MGSSGQSSTQSLPKWAQPYAKEGVEGLFNQFFPGGSPGPYPGPAQQVAPLTADQQAAFDASRTLAGTGPGSVQSDYAPFYSGKANPFANVSNPFSPDQQNQYLDPYIKKAQEGTIAQFKDTIAPGILNQAAQTGTLGGAGHGLATAAAQDAMIHELGDIDTSIREPAYEAAQNRYQTSYEGGQNRALSAFEGGENRALTAAEQQVQGQLAANQAYGQAGQQQQQQQQNVLDTQYGNQYRSAMWPYNTYSQVAGDFGGLLGNQMTTKVSGGK